MLTVGSVFPVIGATELGLERTGRFKTIWFTQAAKYPRIVLANNWPDIPNYGDPGSADFRTFSRPDILTGSPPCNDVSLAGTRRGVVDGKFSCQWKHYARAIRTLRPRAALIENVPGLRSKGLCDYLADLAAYGYDAEWHSIRACWFGAPHRRERLFVIAYPHSERRWSRHDNEIPPAEAQRTVDVYRQKRQMLGGWIDATRESRRTPNHWHPESRLDRMADGIASQLDRVEWLGRSTVPQVAQALGMYMLRNVWTLRGRAL